MKATKEELKMIADYKPSKGVVCASGAHWSDDECIDFAKQYHTKQLKLNIVGVPKGEQLVCECGRKLDTFDNHIGVCIECKSKIKR